MEIKCTKYLLYISEFSFKFNACVYLYCRCWWSLWWTYFENTYGNKFYLKTIMFSPHLNVKVLVQWEKSRISELVGISTILFIFTCKLQGWVRLITGGQCKAIKWLRLIYYWKTSK